MQRIVWLVLLGLALPLTALANSVDFSNSGGSLSGSSAGLTLTGSVLSQVVGLGGNGPVSGDLGTIAFTTAALLSGSLATDAVFNSGGSFVITGNGSNGVADGVIFSGTFSSTVAWAFASAPPDGSEIFDMSGNISGLGSTSQIYAVVSPDGFMTVSGTLGSGNTNINLSPVPEPGTLGLIGIGFAGLAAMFLRKKSFTGKSTPPL
jgi:hypothetical protein